MQETPLSDDQKIVTKHDGHKQVTATVKNSLQLRWWLLGFGEYVEVIKPKFLRDEFIEISQSLGKMYS
jgi:predicted DNA-binding transcriptional regulator YafY